MNWGKVAPVHKTALRSGIRSNNDAADASNRVERMVVC